MQVDSKTMTTEETLAAVGRFNDAFGSQDVNTIMALMTEDCIFESTSPAPDGQHYQGQDAVRAVWTDLFGSTPEGRFDAEEVFAADDRCVVRWLYSFKGGHVRGVDVMRFRGGKLTEKLSYVKG